jgi:hypothetical protein
MVMVKQAGKRLPAWNSRYKGTTRYRESIPTSGRCLSAGIKKPYSGCCYTLIFFQWRYPAKKSFFNAILLNNTSVLIWAQCSPTPSRTLFFQAPAATAGLQKNESR